MPRPVLVLTVRDLANQLPFTHNPHAKRWIGDVVLEGFGGMSFFRNVSLGAALAVALSLSMLPEAARAYTPEEQQACQPDAMRLCGNFIPDVDRITACMVEKKSQLSPECRKFFRADPEPAAGAAPAGEPLTIKPVTARKSKAKAKVNTKAKKTTKPAPT
jgi:hypothetical protein